ncbi:Antagonist of MEN (Mitotic Exit Network) [Mortierella sp. AD011]|nr:Antagonist of MEN (Mitotic Exit Network) [Mortierella sp. AD011]
MSGPSHSFFRRLLKVFVGGNNTEHQHQQGYDLCNRKAHSLEGNFYDSSSTLEDRRGSEHQMNSGGSSDEYKCSRSDQHISNGKMMATSPPPGSQSNSVARYKKRSNSTATTSSITSDYRLGRTASLSRDSTGSGSDYSSCSSDMSNRRSSVTSSISGESIHYDLGTIGRSRAFMNNNQQYRQHFTGNCGSTTNTTNPAQKDIIKRRISLFKASRRGSDFSTKSQDTAVNSIDINPADESEHDGETEDMDLDDEDDEILDDYNDTEEEENGEMDYTTHDSGLTAKMELDPRHRRQQERTHRQSKRVRQLYNSLLFRNRIGGCTVHTNPLFELERRPSPIQLPEILHLIFQFVIDLTPADEYSQREIYNCLLVCRQWYLIAQKTLWREIRLRNPEKLELFADLLKRTESVEHLGNERNNRMRLHQKQQKNQMMSAVTIIRQHQRHVSTMRYEQESIMAPVAMQKRLRERGSAVKKIVLHKLKLIEDQDIMPLTTWFHNLQILEFYICEKLTDKIVVAVAENCPRLQQLLMPGCAKITDVGISQIALRCPKMKHLDLRACSNVSDESLLLVARHCPELWHLNVGRVSSAPKVTGKSIVEIAKNTNLNTLGLAGCGMTDEAVIEIARHSHSGLHRISLNSCPLLTSASIRALMELCPNLAVLEIKQCVLVTDMATVYRFSTRRVLVELCPELQRRLLEYKVELSEMNNSTQEATNNNNNTMTQTPVAGQSANQHYHDNLSIQQQTTATVITDT